MVQELGHQPFHCRARVQSLVGELSSCKPTHSKGKKRGGESNAKTAQSLTDRKRKRETEGPWRSSQDRGASSLGLDVPACKMGLLTQRGSVGGSSLHTCPGGSHTSRDGEGKEAEGGIPKGARDGGAEGIFLETGRVGKIRGTVMFTPWEG